jgi:transposase
VAAAAGELRGEQTVQVGQRGFDALLRWARGLDRERVWVLEDCRHVSGSLERFLIGRGERVLRIATHLSATARRSSRQRVALNGTLQWHLHDLWPELQLPGSSLFYGRWAPRVARRLARAEQTMRVRIARDELRRIRELSQAIKALEREIAALVTEIAPQLLSEPGFGPLTAAKLVGEIAGAHRFATAAKLARAAGVAPIPASSGNTRRQRLDQGGNRQINAALHRVIVTRARCHPETRDYIARRQAEGKTTREAIRCLKRYLARHVWRLLQPPHPDQGTPPSPSIP